MVKRFYLFNTHNARSLSKFSTILNSLKIISTIKIKFLCMDEVLFRTTENRSTAHFSLFSSLFGFFSPPFPSSFVHRLLKKDYLFLYFEFQIQKLLSDL